MQWADHALKVLGEIMWPHRLRIRGLIPPNGHQIDAFFLMNIICGKKATCSNYWCLQQLYSFFFVCFSHASKTLDVNSRVYSR